MNALSFCCSHDLNKCLSRKKKYFYLLYCLFETLLKYCSILHVYLKQRIEISPNELGSYHLDSHNTQRFVTPEGYIQNEGYIGVKTDRPYSIDYGAIIPKEKDCRNLFVLVCLSSSHITNVCIRMEPGFMILGQSAATAAVLSIQNNTSVQKLPYDLLAKQLIKDHQV